MRPTVAPDLRAAGAVSWLSRIEPVVAGPSLGEVALFRGFKDDFLGDLLDDRYEQRTEAAARSSLVLQDGAHGGVLRLLTGNVAADYARIMLGDQTYATDNLDPDDGFELIGYWKLSATTSILGDMFVNAPVNEHIHVTADTDQGGNWYLRTFDGVGVDTFTDSGVAIDTDWHWHRLLVESQYAAHYLDGALINYTAVEIPTIPMTANMRCLARANASKYVDLDFCAVIAR